jgi:hypothetical protein
MMAKEEFVMLRDSLTEYFEERQRLLEESASSKPRLFCYDCHDGKMIYQYLQCSPWNRKHHPFILCKCKRNIGVKNNEDHECEIFTDEEYSRLWIRSKRHYDHKKPDDASHRDWCNSENFGVTHFSIHPSKSPVSTIRFDVFHVQCSIVRQIMGYTRLMVLTHSSELKNVFTEEVLMKIWKHYILLYCWNTNMNFSCLQGSELSLFVSNVQHVIDFVCERMLPTTETQALIRCLEILPKIVIFIEFVQCK